MGFTKVIHSQQVYKKKIREEIVVKYLDGKCRLASRRRIGTGSRSPGRRRSRRSDTETTDIQPHL